MKFPPEKSLADPDAAANLLSTHFAQTATKSWLPETYNFSRQDTTFGECHPEEGLTNAPPGYS
jgi:hypothetical protein